MVTIYLTLDVVKVALGIRRRVPQCRIVEKVEFQPQAVVVVGDKFVMRKFATFGGNFVVVACVVAFAN